MNKQKGFTIVELLVVVLIIGVLSGVLLGVLNASGVRAKARDGQRKADLDKIRVALELYYADYRAYPLTAEFPAALETGYMSAVPVDPLDTTGTSACTADAYGYYYESAGDTYVLSTLMEVETSNDDSPCGCATATLHCYQVTNP